ncbi:Zn-ribbon domain-containing OB-fold protein [Rhodococcus sp. WS4]|nr:Zn-ribbon domain-containing OB-fold protein [Rhodococcus sp. WS4]
MTITAPAEVRKPLPEVNSVNKIYWDAAADHVLKVQQCPNCDRYQYPAVVLCPGCSSEMGWVTASGRGTLHTFTIIRLVFHPAFEREVPYNVSVVELEEGPLMITNVVGIDDDELEIGMPLRVVFDDVAEGVSVPKFTPEVAR